MSLRSRYVLFALAVLFAALFVRLGWWQLSRLHDRRAANAQATLARAEPVMDLNGNRKATGLMNRRVVVRGEYDRAQEIVLRGFVYREVPGVQVVTPLRIPGTDSAVLVNRGYVPSPDAMTVDLDSLNEPGTVTVRGYAFPIPVSQDGGAPLVHNGKETWRRLDLAGLRERLPYPVLDAYIIQSPDSMLPRYPRRLEPPVLDDGPHLSYAIQWFAFAIIALAGGWIFVLRMGR